MPNTSIDLFKRTVYAGDAKLLSDLFQQHPELKSRVNEPLFHFDTPAIVQAAGHGNRELIDVLLNAGADINARSQWWAGSFGVLDTINPGFAPYLIERGAIVDAHAAARLGMLERLQKLLAANPALVHARGGDGKTPLHFASTVPVAEYLLDHGASINALDVDHESTPAQHLVDSAPDVVRYLIQRGAETDLLLTAAVGDIDLVRKHLDADPGCIRMRVNEIFFPKRDPRSGGKIYIWTLGMNRSAHQIAGKFGHDEIVALLMERSPADAKFTNACAVGDQVSAKALLAENPDLVKTLSGDDLHLITEAAQDNNAEAVKLMLECGWPVDGGRPETPLHWAAFHGNAAIVREILGYRPPLEAIDPTHQGTPLGWAIYGSEHSWHCKKGNYGAVVEALLQAGAKPSPWTGGSEAVRAVLQRFATS